MVVLAHHRSVKKNSPFSCTVPAPHRCESASIAYGPHCELTLDSPIGQSIYSAWGYLADLVGYVVPSGDDHVRTKIPDQLLIRTGRVSDDPKPVRFR